jgi:GNAT superfamily N-acetyltransferase
MQPFQISGVTIRELEPTDSFDELTALLHLAYAPLADMGLRFWATHQLPTDTRDRCSTGRPLVGEIEKKLVATVTFYGRSETSGSPWLDNQDVASFGQFAVHPNLQGLGIGSRLIQECERLAMADNAIHLALDTSENAIHLIEYYRARGFQVIEHVKWDSVNYRSVVMSKPLLNQP